MPAIRYVVPQATSSAFVPVPAATTAVVAYKGDVTGRPGTQPVPAGQPELTSFVNGLPVRSGYSGGTTMMPPVWFPQEWYERHLSETPPVSVYSDNQMPVPANDPRGRAALMANRPQFLGQSQLRQPRALPKWSNWLPTRSYGS